MTTMLRVLIICIALLMPACAGNDTWHPYSAAETRALLAYNRTVVMIDVDNGSGSGTFVSPSVVLTNFHVIRHVRTITITPNGLALKYTAHVIHSDPNLDLAILYVEGYRSPFVASIADQPVPPYTNVYAIGHPVGLPLIVTDGRYQYRHNHVCDVITAPIFFGNSGGSAVVYNRTRDRMELIGVPKLVYGLRTTPYQHSVCIVPLPIVKRYLAENLKEG